MPTLRTLLALGLILVAAFPARAAQSRLRAREHFESGEIDLGNGFGELDYTGWATVLNLYREEPWEWMYGLTLQRGTYESIGETFSLKTTAVGLEGKIYPVRRGGVRSFLRGGVLAQALDQSGAPKDFWTYGGLAAVGLEMPVGKLGLSSEAGGRLLWGSRGRAAQLLYVGLGLHFYLFPGDAMPEKTPPAREPGGTPPVP